MFITRHWKLISYSNIEKTIAAIVEQHITDKKQVNYNYLGFHFLHTVGVKQITRYGEIISIGQMISLFKKYIQSLSSAERQKLWPHFKVVRKMYADDKFWLATPEVKLKRMMQKYFVIKSVEHGADHPFGEYCPIYVLKNT